MTTNFNQYSLELEDVLRMIRFQANNANNNKGLNETATYGIAGSFPHYKHFMMPPDQKEKLLAMHRASRANAGIYVAVVLGVYLILLTMLLCRYAKRHRPSGEAQSLLTAVPPASTSGATVLPPPNANTNTTTTTPTSTFFSCGGGNCNFRCHLTPARVVSMYKRICCGGRRSHHGNSRNNNNPARNVNVNSGDDQSSIHEIHDFPMTSLNPSSHHTQIEAKGGKNIKYSSNNRPVNV